MRTRIKICCIASAEEAQLAIRAGADALGFVATRPPSLGTIPDTRIAQIASIIPPPVAAFLLTSEQSAEAISGHIRQTRPAAVQILRHIDPTESARLTELEPQVRRVQVIHVEGPAVLDLIPRYMPHVHAFLLDSGRPHAATPVFGGTGRPHDWAVSAEFVKASRLPVFLAGGLSAANAEEAIRQVRPFGLDLCSGVRTEGRLDVEKLAAFVAAVRRADEDPGPA